MTFAEFRERLPRVRMRGRGGHLELWLLAYPAIIMMISHTMMATIDTIMVSRLGVAEIGAVSLGALLTWTFYSLFNGMIQSTNTFVAQFFGADDREECARFTWQGIWLGLAGGVVLCTLSPASGLLFDVMRPSPQVREMGTAYLRISFLGGGFFLVYLNLSCFFRGIGDTKTPMKVAIAANIVNVLGDYLLIFGHLGFPRMGVEGAAVATVLASLSGTLIFLGLYLGRRLHGAFRTRALRAFSMDRFTRMVRLGFPIGIQYFLDIGSFLVFSAYIGRMGDAPLAANHIVIRILSFSFMPCYGISIAATSLVGQYIGAKDIPNSEASGYNAVRIGLVYTALIAVAFLLVPGPLARIFTPDREVIAFVRRILLPAALFQVFDGVQLITSGSLRGAGDTRWPMTIAVLYAWVLFLPLAWVFGDLLSGGVVGAWIGATIYIILLGATILLRYRSGAWKAMAI